MEKYINKSALVAEIKKKIRTEQGYSSGDEECGYRDCAKDILSFLDTLEVKNVNLEEEVDKKLEECNWEFDKIDFYKFAQYFYELGLKQKESEV